VVPYAAMSSTHLRIKAFDALVPTADRANLVNCVPYDVINTEEAKSLANPYSLLHVDRAEIDLPEGTDIHSDAVYAKAAENFKLMQEKGWLVREGKPCLYIYRQKMGGHVQTGLAAVCHVEDYDKDVIKKHEKTRQKKEDDRTTLNRTLSAHPGPVFLTYKAQDAINAIVAQTCADAPLIDFTAPDAVQHTIWKIADPAAVVGEFGKIPVSYVADGHHRSASAARVGKERREANLEHTGDEDYNWFLTVSFPHDELKILPYNRVVKDLNGYTKEALLSALSELGELAPAMDPNPGAVGEVCIYLGGQWFKLTLPPLETDDVIARLDVSRLQDRILDPLLAVGDPRTSDRVDFIGGIRGTGELEKLVDGGDWEIAFSLYPVTIQQLMDIADAGSIMPPKSTWFEPKLRSGLFVNLF